MVLSAEEIRRAVGADLVINPFEPALLKPASYTLRLGRSFRRWSGTQSVVDPWSADAGAELLGPREEHSEIVLRPGDFVLGCTLEAVQLPPHLTGLLAPLSHWARFGLAIHQGAFLVSPGYGTDGPTPLTLELASANPSPLLLRSGLPICHLVLQHTTAASVTRPLGRSIYDGVAAPSEPRLFEEFAALLGDLDATG